MLKGFVLGALIFSGVAHADPGPKYAAGDCLRFEESDDPEIKQLRERTRIHIRFAGAGIYIWRPIVLTSDGTLWLALGQNEAVPAETLDNNPLEKVECPAFQE